MRPVLLAYPAGLVLVEADAGDVEPQAMQDDDHRGNARNLIKLRECRDSVAAGKPLPPFPTWSPPPSARSTMRASAARE